MMIDGLAKVGQFCPNAECARYCEIGQAHIIRFGQTAKGTQRYRCKSCGQTFVETRGTLFYGKHTPQKEILETLALLAEGVRLASLTRAKGFKEDTILSWLREAAQHAAQVEALLMQNYQVTHAQIDALWTYVGHKGQKGAMRKATKRAPSGGVR
jgi:transposase-like protein